MHTGSHFELSPLHCIIVTLGLSTTSMLGLMDHVLDTNLEMEIDKQIEQLIFTVSLLNLSL